MSFRLAFLFPTFSKNEVNVLIIMNRLLLDNSNKVETINELNHREFIEEAHILICGETQNENIQYCEVNKTQLYTESVWTSFSVFSILQKSDTEAILNQNVDDNLKGLDQIINFVNEFFLEGKFGRRHFHPSS